MGSGPQKYLLSDAESRKVFETEIVRDELEHLKGSGHVDDGLQPLAVILVGQTGAGKTRTAPALKEALTSIKRTPAHFIADTYKTYHPEYANIIKEKPELASPATGPDARKWLEMACQYAIQHRIDCLVESACRHPDDFCSLAQAFHDGGYRVNVAVLAVPEALSLLGILIRYYKNLPEAQSRNLPLRLTPKRVHDDTYTGLLAAAEFVDSSDAVDEVIVVRRNNLVAYHNSREGSGSQKKWKLAPTTERALDVERVRPLTDDELATAHADLLTLEDHKEDRGVAASVMDIEDHLSALQAQGSNMSPFPQLTPLDAAAFVTKDAQEVDASRGSGNLSIEKEVAREQPDA